jgi:hypothetical protein
LANEMYATAFAKQIMHVLSPWRILNALMFKFQLVSCIKRPKKSSRDLG